MKVVVVVLALVLAALFCKSFQPSQVLFSNDGPLGTVMAEQNSADNLFPSSWQNLNWLGDHAPMPGPSIGFGIRALNEAGLLPWVALVAVAVGAYWWGRRECWYGRARKAVALSCFGTAAGIVAGMVSGQVGILLLCAQCGGMVFAGSIIATYALRTDL